RGIDESQAHVHVGYLLQGLGKINLDSQYVASDVTLGHLPTQSVCLADDHWTTESSFKARYCSVESFEAGRSTVLPPVKVPHAFNNSHDLSPAEPRFAGSRPIALYPYFKVVAIAHRDDARFMVCLVLCRANKVIC